MPTPSEKKLLYIENQMKEADAELGKIPPGAPSYQIMRRLIICSRDLAEVIRGLMPDARDGMAIELARDLAKVLDFSDKIPVGDDTKILPREPE